MGHTITEWQRHVSQIVRDSSNTDIAASVVTDIGVAPALLQFSIDRPQVQHVEATANASAYFDLPPGWVDGFSSLRSVETPTGSNPPVYLDPQSWQMVRKTTDVTTEQILLDRTPGSAQKVRFAFSAPWDMPTSDASADKVSDLAFEAVCSLAASLCCLSLAAQASRDRATGIPSDWVEGRNRSAALLAQSDRLRIVYQSYLGIASSPMASADAPAYGTLDYDPTFYSVFHGSRR